MDQQCQALSYVANEIAKLAIWQVNSYNNFEFLINTAPPAHQRLTPSTNRILRRKALNNIIILPPFWFVF